MRKVKRYAVALRAVEYYIGGLLNELGCPYDILRTDARLTFCFECAIRIASYPFMSTIIEALSFKLEAKRVRIHTGWAGGNQWLFQATTISKQEVDILRGQTRKLPPLQLLKVIKL